MTKSYQDAILNEMAYRIFKHFINLFYPLRCDICKQRLHPENTLNICTDCLHKIRLNLPPHCKQCGRTMHVNIDNISTCIDCKFSDSCFDRVWVICQYNGIIKKCLHLFKSSEDLHYLNLLINLMKNFIDKFININEIDTVTTVPLNKNSSRKITIQSKTLTKRISAIYNKEMILAGSKKEAYDRKNILIIEDLMNENSTEEYAKGLRQKGVNKLYALAIARKS